MSENIGMLKPVLNELPKIEDRMTFLYLEHCQLNRSDSAITVTDADGTVYIPSAQISVLLLGPGTNVTHRAMELIGDSGVTVVWVGEHGVRYYAGGIPLTHKSHLLVKQAALVSNQRSHLAVVRKMYLMRFPDEDVRCLTLQQLRGREGSRIRKVYRRESEKWNVKWTGRAYDPNDFESGDAINQALSAAHACLYGLSHAVIAALGCSPGLGFVHVGHERSFVYDIADLYKAEITIPVAFEVASVETNDIPSTVRHKVRDKFVECKILERMVDDIKYLLNGDDNKEIDDFDNQKAVYLWDDKQGTVDNGISYRGDNDDRDYSN